MLTNDQWKLIQETAPDPYVWTESNEVKKIIRSISLDLDWICGRDSFIASKQNNYLIDVGFGHAIKDDMYVNIFNTITLDIREPLDYVRNMGANITVDREDIFYICLDYKYAHTKPAPFAKVKIAKEKSELLATWTRPEDGKVVPRYLFLYAFGAVFDVNLNVYVIDQMYDSDPNDPTIYRRILDLRGYTEYLEYIKHLSGMEDLKIVPTTPPSNKVQMLYGFFKHTDDTKMLYAPTTTSEEIPGVSVAGKIRYDKAVINDQKQLLILRGVEVNNALPELYQPLTPPGHYDLGILKIDEVEGVDPVVLDEEDILDAREFFNKGNAEVPVYQRTKRDWDTETEEIWTLDFMPDYSEWHNIFQDRLHSILYEHFIAINNLIKFDTVPINYSTIQAKPKRRQGQMLCFYKANNFDIDWSLPLAVNTDLPYLIGADGLTMEQDDGSNNGGYTLDSTNQIVTWATEPLLLTYALFYVDPVSDDGFDKMANKTDWTGNAGDDIWNLNFEPDQTKPMIMIGDLQDFEPGVDFIFLTPTQIQFITPPVNHTYLVAYEVGEQKTQLKQQYLNTALEGSPQSVFTVPETIDASGILYGVADKKILEPFVDFNITDEHTFELTFDAEEYVKFIYYTLD